MGPHQRQMQAANVWFTKTVTYIVIYTVIYGVTLQSVAKVLNVPDGVSCERGIRIRGCTVSLAVLREKPERKINQSPIETCPPLRKHFSSCASTHLTHPPTGV